MSADSKRRGRPSNEDLIRDGKLIVSKKCKICQSNVRDEITQYIITNIPSSKIITDFGQHFNPPLTPTNIHSHKQHINPDIAVAEDRKRALTANVTYSETTKQLYKHRYDEEFNKAKASEALYKQRLTNLLHLQREIEKLNLIEEDDNKLTPMDNALRIKLVGKLEEAYKGFNQDLMKHIALDADLYVKQVNIQYIKLVQRAYLAFTQKYMDILIKEIEDPVTRERLKEHLGDLLDAEVAPILDPNKAIEAEYVEVKDVKPAQK